MLIISAIKGLDSETFQHAAIGFVIPGRVPFSYVLNLSNDFGTE